MAKWFCEACGNFLGQTATKSVPPVFPGATIYQRGGATYMNCKQCAAEMALKAEPPGGTNFEPMWGVRIEP
jgi:hypothetical protein